jgi:hypothetical protein
LDGWPYFCTKYAWNDSYRIKNIIVFNIYWFMSYILLRKPLFRSTSRVALGFSNLSDLYQNLIQDLRIFNTCCNDNKICTKYAWNDSYRIKNIYFNIYWFKSYILLRKPLFRSTAISCWKHQFSSDHCS